MNRKPAKNDTRTKNVLAASRAIRGIERAEHFASGGTVSMWRGRHSCTKNGKAEASRNACRSRDW